MFYMFGRSPAFNFGFNLFIADITSNRFMIQPFAFMFFCMKLCIFLFKNISIIRNTFPEQCPFFRSIECYFDIIFFRTSEFCQNRCFGCHRCGSQIPAKQSIDQCGFTSLDCTNKCDMKYRIFAAFNKIFNALDQAFIGRFFMITGGL